jgi:hypothetical protein
MFTRLLTLVTALASALGLARPRERHVEALAWLARLKRGLRESEGPRLLEWLRRAAHRKHIARMAAEWHDPEILAALGEMFPIDPAILEPPPPRRSPLVSVAIALAVFGSPLLFILAIHFVLVLHAGQYLGDRAIHVSVLLAYGAAFAALGVLILRDRSAR